MPLEEKLDQKYAQMWNEACLWKIPTGIVPFEANGVLTEREVALFAEGCWNVLENMADDGLITRSALRRYHEKENNWPPGQSKIEVGYAPPNFKEDRQ